jgi:hypothetical protein
LNRPEPNIIRYSLVQHKMSLQPYVFPPVPSPQVKAAQEYLKYISEFDFERLSNLLTDDFTLTMSPVNMGIPPKTKAEEFSVLKELQTKLDGKSLAVSGAQAHPFLINR